MRKLFIVIFVFILSSFIFYGVDKNIRYHKGPPENNFDGVRFHNYQSIMHNPFDFLKWRLVREREEWAPITEVFKYEKPEALVEGDKIKITYIGHASFLVQCYGKNILIDPILSQTAGPFSWLGSKRIIPAAINYSDLPHINAVLLSHSHYDHLDLPTLNKLYSKYSPYIVSGLGVIDSYIRDSMPKIRGTELGWWDSYELSEDVKIHFVPAHHWTRRGLFDRNKTLWGGFVLETPGGNIYFIGDTGFGDGRIFKAVKAKFESFKVAIVPIGSYKPRWFMKNFHMGPDEAVEVIKIIEPEVSIPMHYDVFQLGDEEYGEAIREFREHINMLSNLRDKIKILQLGEGLYAPQ